MDVIVKHGGRNTKTVVKYYIEATSSGQVQGSKKKPSQSYADARELPCRQSLGETALPLTSGILHIQ